MKRMIYICLLMTSLLMGEGYERKLQVLGNSLDPNSLTQLFAFYNLYPTTEEGKRAYLRAWELINLHRSTKIQPFNLKHFSFSLDPIISLVTKDPSEETIILSDQELSLIELLSDHLGNKRLKGHSIWNKSEILDLDESEIDLARALLLYQYDPIKESNLIRSYEALLDMMAIQILSRLPKNPTPVAIMEAMNNFIFHEMRYRFPPHSLWAKDVDTYTFLPSVLDSRHGVCLGVSILYLSLAQRLNLPLEIVTPPGHIYIRYNDHGAITNIETTARGIHLPCDTYLGINTWKLKMRSIREVIGLNFQNAAATAWQYKDHQKALELYNIALPLMPDDSLLHLFMGYNHLFLGDEEKAKEFLQYVKDHPIEEMVFHDTTIDDYLQGKVDAEGIRVTFQEVDETRESIIKKQESLFDVTRRHPNYKEGVFHLAVTYLQLGRNKEAFTLLEQYHTLESGNPTVEYYLSLLASERLEYQKASAYLNNCEEILTKKNHLPKALNDVKRSLRQSSPAIN